ncbi:MAG: type II and III secretion system protein family protein [Planctomycetota bacterium]|jgi:pilus assembly protein CpaC
MKERKKKIRVWHLTALICSCLALLWTFGPFDAEGQIVENNGVHEQQISIVVGQSQVVQAPWPTIRVAVTDPRIANVQILTPNQVLLQGLAVGSTDLIMWNEDETEIWQVAVKVILDIESHMQKLRQLFPDCRIDLDQSGSTLIAKGTLRKTNQAGKLREYLKKTGVEFLDMTNVAGTQQVQLQVRVAEVSRNVTKVLSTNFIYADSHFFGASTPSSSSGEPLISAIFTKPVDYLNTSWEASSAVSVLAGVPRANFDLFINALAENQYLRILANPTLVALSGEEATFLAGGEFPIPVPQGGSNDSITIEYKEYGVRLTFRPTVLGDGTIKLYVAPEVSELTTVGSVNFGGFEVPAVTTRRMETTLELNSGQTFAMAGLLRSNTGATNARLPGLGDLPILGPLFRSVRYEKDETELVVLVTAVLVEPMSLAQVPPLPGFLHSEPTDWEFYIEGKIDGSKPAKVNPADAEWMQQMGLDELMGPGAWDSYDNPASPSRSDIEQDENIYEQQSSYNDNQSAVVEEQIVSSRHENGVEAVILITDVKE